MTTPYQPPRDASGKEQYLFQDHNPYFSEIEILKAARAARILLRKQTMEADQEGSHGRERLRDAVRKVVDQHKQSLSVWNPAEDLGARRQLAVEQLRDFREKWGLVSGLSSRANSRAPSRRVSAVDVSLESQGELPRTVDVMREFT